MRKIFKIGIGIVFTITLLFGLQTFYYINIGVRGISGIPFKEEPKERTNIVKIPRIIHQIWKTNDTSTYTLRPSSRDWQNQNPGFEYKLWTDDQIEQLIKEEYPWLYEDYKSYPYNIQRADLARYVLLYHEGGTYADLDAWPGHNGLTSWLEHSVVLPEAGDGSSVSNFWFMTEKKSPFFRYLLDHVHEHNVWIALPYVRVFWSTGPFFIGKMIRDFMRSHPDYDLVILRAFGKESGARQRDWVVHKAGRSWHNWDAIILNWFGDLSTRKFIVQIVAPIVLSILIYFFWKKIHKRNINTGNVIKIA
eukprot:TRINITY_DN3038_c0_g1_i1.p1 TRINITY_DN3038_c0_g1~~TRINITY_DN3038_c0_g1_i1.p1  ORF type:complete len:306 (+),score=45.44 TRINITY_DN3038_c0_g1_i1:187-1104(+)